MASNGTMILCDGLVKIYKVQDLEVVALQGLDLLVDRGEFMAIIGPSGSGKSSLLNILGGLDRPTAGKAIIDGHDMLKLSTAAVTRYRRDKVGFLWQQPSRNLISYLTVADNVEMPMLLAGKAADERKEWVRELLEEVGLWERREHSVHQLSGGEQQRTAIAVALANKPILLLADEPTGEVDSVTAGNILDTLRRLNETYSLTVVTVTHDVRIANQVDRVVSIRDGKTSSERFRHVHAVDEEEAPGPDGENGASDKAPTHQISYHEYVVVDAAGRLQLPHDYMDQLGIRGRVELELAEDGILVKPATGLGSETSETDRIADTLSQWQTAQESRGVGQRVARLGQSMWKTLVRRQK